MNDKQLFSYSGKIVRVNLSNNEIHSEATEKYAADWIGGPGIAVKILYDELRNWATPFDPVNPVVFGAGTLLGTTAPGACKSNISTLGPMTGGWASSMSDSYSGLELKYAGYDSVVITGKSRQPVYLWITDDKVVLRDARHLWGATTWETLSVLREEFGDPNLHVISIGPAGENLARGACVVQDRSRAFGRCGIGAVLGSKNVKAIVAKGSGSIQVANPEAFTETSIKLRKMIRASKSLENIQRYGTLGSFDEKQAICGTSYKNFQEVYVPDDVAEKINPTKTIDKHRIGRQSYPGCAVGCGIRLELNDGPYQGLVAECNQWEVFGTLQARLAIEEPTFMIKANALCDQMGLDVDAAGGSIGWAMECFQRGIINEGDTGGLKLEWGDAEVALELIRKISYREGFGNILAEGCAKAADLIQRGSEYYAIHVKGQDLYEPGRGALGWMFGTAVSTRGGGHTTGTIIDPKPDIDEESLQKARQIFGVENPFNHLDYDGRAKMVLYMEVLHRINNCLGICHFNSIHWAVDMLDLPHLAELYSLATGRTTDVDDLKKMAMKQLNLEKAFNLRFTNFSRDDDLPAARERYEPIPTGPLAGWKLDEDKYNAMLDEYYDLHGWDEVTSYPTQETLSSLGLESVAEDLRGIGKLGQERGGR